MQVLRGLEVVCPLAKSLKIKNTFYVYVIYTEQNIAYVSPVCAWDIKILLVHVYGHQNYRYPQTTKTSCNNIQSKIDEYQSQIFFTTNSNNVHVKNKRNTDMVISKLLA